MIFFKKKQVAAPAKGKGERTKDKRQKTKDKKGKGGVGNVLFR